jgi:WD40 repeat protein
VFLTEAHPIYEDIFVTGTYKGDISFWNIKTKECIKTFNECPTEEEDIFSLAEIFDGKFMNNGKVLLTWTSNQSFSIYSIYEAESYIATPIYQCVPKTELQIMDETPGSLKDPSEYKVEYSGRYEEMKKEHMFFENCRISYRYSMLEDSNRVILVRF